MISGTPTAIASSATYTVIAVNSGGSTSFELVITVNDIAPSALSYSSPNVFTKNSAIVDLNPSVSGGAVLSYAISPALPSGLSFDTASGVISGTPTAIASSATYTFIAVNSGGSTSFDVIITVNDVVPSALAYSSPNMFTKNSTITNLSPSITGIILSYAISPDLPNGLSFNTTSGVISGSPTAIAGGATYTVTAFNSGGSTSFDVVITVNDVVLSSLSYASPNMFTRNSAIVALNPNFSGGAVLSYAVSPALPSGLSLNTTSGMISGTPTDIAGGATYTVTAVNSGGSTSFDVVITVNDVAPSALSYASPNVFTVGNNISEFIPTYIGTINSFKVVPDLPNGLIFDAITGIISGIPEIESETKIYIITGTNNYGSTSFEIEITIDKTLNVGNNNLKNSSVFPNPFSEILNISGISSFLSYKMFAIEGRLIQSGEVINSRMVLRDLPSGVYFLKLISEGKEEIKKIIKN